MFGPKKVFFGMPLKPLIYIVHLEGKTEFINLRVSEGEMDEWQKFKKSE